jgi:hypothetical protein
LQRHYAEAVRREWPSVLHTILNRLNRP